MINSQRDAFMVAQKKLGYDINTTDKLELENTYKLLCDEKKYVYAYLQDETYECMISEDMIYDIKKLVLDEMNIVVLGHGIRIL